MNKPDSKHLPTDISLHRKSRVLSISFDDGKRFELPCEYLRVFSPAAEVVTRDVPESGKEGVNIERVEPQGSYAVRLVFDDGHDTGIYSWGTLYELGRNREQKWQQYLDRLQSAGIRRAEQGAATQGKREITLLYFAYLPNKLHTESETLELPASVGDVSTLLTFLQRQKRERGYLLAADNVQVTVNKQFAEPFTSLENGDEVGIVPVSPTPPAPPSS